MDRVWESWILKHMWGTLISPQGIEARTPGIMNVSAWRKMRLLDTTSYGKCLKIGATPPCSLQWWDSAQDSSQPPWRHRLIRPASWLQVLFTTAPLPHLPSFKSTVSYFLIFSIVTGQNLLASVRLRNLFKMSCLDSYLWVAKKIWNITYNIGKKM